MAAIDPTTLSYVGPLAGVLALAFAGFLAAGILRHSAGNDRMREIQKAVRDGAFAFLKLEYTVVAVFAVALAVVFLVVGMVTGDGFWYYTAGGFLVGAVLSALAGYIGMWISVSSNARVAEAARKGVAPALALSFRAGAVNGFAVVGLGILGLGLLYVLFRGQMPVQAVPLNLIGFAFGASLITLFARIAGGIYTKAADVGADLVGKVEAGIPEDDPRNPAVIADNVGDNVGDCAGMGADLFETYVVTLVATMTLAATTVVFTGANGFAGYGEDGILFPLTLGALAILASIVGMYAVRLPKSGNIMNGLYQGMIVTVLASALLFAATWYAIFPNIHVNFLYATFIGLALTLALVFVTDYFTSQGYKPVRGIVDASVTGPATNIIQGLAVGLQSVIYPVVFVVAALVTSFLLGEFAGAGLGLYGVAMAAVGMLSVAGMVVALDTYGPITDNAGGVAEMSDLPKDVRKVTDALDAVGNTTKATTKGYAIGSAALAALVLFADFVDHTNVARLAQDPTAAPLVFEISSPYVLSGLLLGAAVVFLFGSYAMAAVGRAANSVVLEVRRQFADGEIMAGKRQPDYAACVQIVTKAALKEMVVPGSLAVGAPLLIGFILGPLALGGMIMGTIVGGFALALLMSNAGGAWDNAKKAFETGVHGGKGSDAHKAAVVGDTVGDPFKDTAGPAINPLIKAMTTISVIFAGLVVAYSLVGA